MAGNSDIKYHISSVEREKWNDVITRFNTHHGSAGTANHALANGTIPGFSDNNFTTAEKTKLNSVQERANFYEHPAQHPWTMISGLTALANTADWSDIKNVPQRVKDVENGVADAATVSGGIRITIDSAAPSNPKQNKELWIDTTNYVLKIYNGTTWLIIGAAWR